MAAGNPNSVRHWKFSRSGCTLAFEDAISVQQRSLMEDIVKFLTTAIFVAVCVVLVFFLLRLIGAHFP